MSHFTHMRTQLTDSSAIEQALKDLGYQTVERHEVAQPLVGFPGIRQGQRSAHVIVRRKHLDPSYSDLGFERGRDGYWTLWADRDFLKKHATFGQGIAQRHAYHVAKSKLQEQGYTVSEEAVDADGTIQLVMQRIV